MELRRLGRTDLRLSPLGLGCWQFARGRGLTGSYWPALDEATTRAVVATSIEAGVNWFDTAEAYGQGASERSLVDALRAAEVEPGRIVVATKWWPTLRTSPSVLDTFHHREEALRPFPIDLHQVHHPYALSPVEAVIRAMAKLKRKGRIKAIGVSNYDQGRLERALLALREEELHVASNQVKYSLLDRSIEANGLLAFCRNQRVSVLAYSPLEQGLLSGKYHRAPELLKKLSLVRRFLPRYQEETLQRTRPVVEAVESVAAEQGATPAQVALSWVMAKGVFAIAGARSADQARDNTGALEVHLTPAQMSRLDEVSTAFRTQPVR
ncbi:MAG: aldo/keto reductase [Myxococcota bacterium]